MLRLRPSVVCLGLSVALLGFSPAVAGAGRGGGIGRAHFVPHLAPQISAPRVAPQMSTLRLGYQSPRALPSLGIPPSRWGKPASAATAWRAYASVTPRVFHVRAEQGWGGSTGSIRQIRVWPGQSSAFVRRPFSIAPYGGLHTPLHTRLQRPQSYHHVGRHNALWSGVLFWPYASWDLFDYTFNPYPFESFWAYPYPDLYEGIFGHPAIGAYAPVPATAVPETDEPCGADAFAAWPIEQIVQRLKLTDAQRAALDALNEAANRGFGPDVLSASCTRALPDTPVTRIEAMRVRLLAILRNLGSIRPLLVRFHALLDDTQKTQLSSPITGGAQCGQDLRVFPTLLDERIVRELQANAAQRAALRELQHALMAARTMTQAPCTGENGDTVVARLDQIEMRLNAAVRAMEGIEPALRAFYGLLGEEQKRRFNRIAAQSG
jgi:hypothetical protein